MALDPVLLLLDEPVAGMNHDESAELMRYVGRLRGDLRFTTLLIEHDVPLVMSLADRVLALDFGRPIALGTPAEIQADPRVIEAYLGAGAVPHGMAAAPEGEVPQ